ncbi:hypothetical protein EDB83DRAFT_2676049, partial [Lactarius deliciosus]
CEHPSASEACLLLIQVHTIVTFVTVLVWKNNRSGLTVGDNGDSHQWDASIHLHWATPDPNHQLSKIARRVALVPCLFLLCT